MDRLKKVSVEEMKNYFKKKGEAERQMTIEEISKDFLRRPFDELAMIEAGRMLSVCNYKINKASKQTLSSEKVDTAGLTVEQLQTKLTDLVAAKHFALGIYPGGADAYLKKIFERACFKGLDEKRKKKTMALWLDWIQQSPQDLHIGGVKFGGLYQSGGVAGFPNYFDFEKYEATTKNKKGEDDWIEEMTRRITKETRGDEADVWDDRVPELAFLPIALCMSSGCVIRDRIDYWRSFFLCVSSTDKTKTTFLDIDERGGRLGRCFLGNGGGSRGLQAADLSLDSGI